MTNSKQTRLIIASTIGAVVLLAFLIIILVYQTIAIGVEKQRQVQLNQTIREYDTLISEWEGTLEQHQKLSWLELQARKLGYTFSDSHLYK